MNLVLVTLLTLTAPNFALALIKKGFVPVLFKMLKWNSKVRALCLDSVQLEVSFFLALLQHCAQMFALFSINSFCREMKFRN